jgi:hypothetical protein
VAIAAKSSHWQKQYFANQLSLKKEMTCNAGDLRSQI